MGSHPEFRRLAFLMHSIIDSMINYGSRKQNTYVFSLLNLLFSVLFRHQSFAFYLHAAAELKAKAQRKKLKARARGAEPAAAVASGGQLLRLNSHTSATSGSVEEMGGGEGSGENWGGQEAVAPPPPHPPAPQLPMSMGMIVQQLGYLLSFFPAFDPDVQASVEVRRAEQDLSRLRGQLPHPRDSVTFSNVFAPLPDARLDDDPDPRLPDPPLQ